MLDVRSPGEYNHAHIPGAYNLPLFTDDERKIVGTTYKQQSREAAIKVGLTFFGPKMKQMVEEAEQICNKQFATGKNSIETDKLPFVDRPLPIAHCLLIHCWRGGMRSDAVAWLMDLYGYKVYLLSGGYKKFRNYVLDTFKLPFDFKILGGYTGSGKTELLNALKEKGENIIDLEHLANHKGSAFGNLDLHPQPTQEMFENLLAIELRKATAELSDSIPTFRGPEGRGQGGFWIEDESQRIGLVNIPHELWKTMRRSPVFFLDIPFDVRLENLVRQYGNTDPDKLISAAERITQKLGGLNTKTAISLINEGRIKESFEILLSYYDRVYFKALHNREAVQTLLHTIECKSITSENASQLAISSQPEKI